MATKKVYRLKRKFKVLLVVLVILAILTPFGWKKYQEYMYTKTDEYAFFQLGYKKDEVKLLLEKLKPEEKEKVLTYEYNEFIPQFVKCKYFIFKNLEGYLSQVITQEDDFFKYHGTDGYDYDNIVALTNVNAIYDFYENTTETNIDDDYAMLVNKYHYLPTDYEPDDLVSIDWKYRLGGAKDYKYARSGVVSAFLEMWNAAKQEDIYLLVDSSYRGYDKQESVYKDYENQKGIKYADAIAARPGYSEHQTGLSLDIYSKECTSASQFKDTKTYAWLIANAYKYGFILRYPKDKQNLTGYNYESWHYRYVGVELATKVYNEGITYDEYYAFYLDKAID